MTSEQVCSGVCFLHSSGDAGARIAVVTAVWPSPHPILGISTTEVQQHLGHFTGPVKVVQQMGAGKAYSRLIACRSIACGLLLCLTSWKQKAVIFQLPPKR